MFRFNKTFELCRLYSFFVPLCRLCSRVRVFFCNFSSTTNSFQSKIEFENFLRSTYDDTRYSYCILKCGPSVPHRQLKALEVKDTRIPGNMGWNWKSSHSEVCASRQIYVLVQLILVLYRTGILDRYPKSLKCE